VTNPATPDVTVRPLLFLDVDGTLLPAGGPRPSTLAEWNEQWQSPSNPQLNRIPRARGQRLLTLPCELMWATAWMADANTVIAPLLGLPALPVVDLGELPGIDDPVWAEQDTTANLNWKTQCLISFAGGRPFVWVDDEITAVDRAWVAARHTGPALLHRVDANRGLTDSDLDVIQAWLRTVGPA
jgi:hypothetical protein